VDIRWLATRVARRLCRIWTRTVFVLLDGTLLLTEQIQFRQRATVQPWRRDRRSRFAVYGHESSKGRGGKGGGVYPASFCGEDELGEDRMRRGEEEEAAGLEVDSGKKRMKTVVTSPSSSGSGAATGRSRSMGCTRSRCWLTPGRAGSTARSSFFSSRPWQAGKQWEEAGEGDRENGGGEVGLGFVGSIAAGYNVGRELYGVPSGVPGSIER
jgi:hypothetical protein